MQVIILMGASGSGKSTYIKNTFNSREAVRPLLSPDNECEEGDVVVLSADDMTFDKDGIFHPQLLSAAHADCLRTFAELVSKKENEAITVIVDNTNTSPWEVSPYVALANAYEEVHITLVVFDENWKLCAARTAHDTPVDIIRKQARRLEETLDDWPPYWPKPTFGIYV